MKKIALLFIFSLLFSCSMKNETTEEKSNTSKSTFASVHEFKHEPIKENGKFSAGPIRRSGHTVTNYNKDGNITDISFQDSKGTVQSKTVNKWEGSKLMEINHYDMKGNLASKKIFTYKGEQKHKAIFHGRTGATGDYEMYQNEADTLEIIELYNSKNELQKRTNASYKNKILTRQIDYNKEGKVTFKNIFTFDEKGDPIVSTTYTYPNEAEYKYKFKTEYLAYDEKGNWTQKAIGNGNKKENIIVRKITYQ